MTKYINLRVESPIIGGDILVEVETVQKLDNFIRQIDEDKSDEDEFKREIVVSLARGLSELDKFFDYYNYDWNGEDKAKWTNLKIEFQNLVNNQPGKFYLLCIEYDLNLLFVAD